MSERSRLTYQIRHYRELAQIALDCSRRAPDRRDEYRDLAKQWKALADRLESAQPKDAQH